jgi:hypothetical protein
MAFTQFQAISKHFKVFQSISNRKTDSANHDSANRITPDYANFDPPPVTHHAARPLHLVALILKHRPPATRNAPCASLHQFAPLCTTLHRF